MISLQDLAVVKSNILRLIESKPLPYTALYQLYRQQIERTRSSKRKQELELVCAILLDIINRQEQDKKLADKIDKLFTMLNDKP